MKKHLVLGVAILSILAITLLPTSAIAAAPRSHLFSGTVTVGDESGAGSIVVAEYEGQGTTVLQVIVAANSRYSMFVAQQNWKPLNGDFITFYVDGIYAATAVWYAGGNEVLDLAVGEGANPIPPPGDSPESVPPTNPISGGGIPASFHGEVTKGGVPCPNSIIEARVNSTVVNSVVANSDSMFFMIVPPVEGIIDGTMLLFYVDGEYGGTHSWHSGEDSTLILTTSGANPLPALSISDNPAIADGLASILSKLVSVTSFKQGEGVGGWTIYNPDWPFESNTLSTLFRLRGYWVNVSEACSLVYGTNVYQLDSGWNLIGWGGVD